MINIDYIMELIDWNNSVEKQEQGIRMAQEVKCINVFLQPGSPYGKNVWDNCAKILASKTDEELKPYLIPLLEWIQDMNWPGAFCILHRIQKFTDICTLNSTINICKRRSKLLNDEVWESNLNILMKKLD